MTNTRIDYMYRDGSNYKTYGHAVLAGELTEEELATVMVNLELSVGDENGFIPAQVGLDALQDNWDSHYDDDHVWHELFEPEPTEEPPTLTTMTASEWAEQFIDITWDEGQGMDSLTTFIKSTPKGR